MTRSHGNSSQPSSQGTTGSPVRLVGTYTPQPTANPARQTDIIPGEPHTLTTIRTPSSTFQHSKANSCLSDMVKKQTGRLQMSHTFLTPVRLSCQHLVLPEASHDRDVHARKPIVNNSFQTCNRPQKYGMASLLHFSISGVQLASSWTSALWFAAELLVVEEKVPWAFKLFQSCCFFFSSVLRL